MTQTIDITPNQKKKRNKSIDELMSIKMTHSKAAVNYDNLPSTNWSN
jgi:hypothetical protein